MAQAKIPKLNDKSIYISRTQNDTLQELSYSVSASFKGILRLSPNNLASLNQSSLNIRDEDITYRDSIYEELGKQMIQVSDSDGVMLDIRFSSDAIGFDKLYVRGTLEVEELSIFNGENLNAFNVSGKNYLPTTRDSQYISNCAASEINQYDYVFPYMKTDWFPSEEEKEIYINEAETNLDNSHAFEKDGKRIPTAPERTSIVVSLSSGEERHFTYRNAKQLIREIIFDSLLDLKTLPTGSIHFVPVNMEQYKILCGKTGEFAIEEGQSYPRPNVYRYGSGELTDPIVRDFLLCDGSSYFTRDFPELAKIINGTRVDVERIIFSGEDGDSVKRLLNYKNNIFDKKDILKTFRVPDLRHKFIRSVALGEKYINTTKGMTGVYNPDNKPNNNCDDDGNIIRHVHHTVYPTYDIEYGNRSLEESYVPVCDNVELTDTPAVAIAASNTWKHVDGRSSGWLHYNDFYYTGNKPCYQGSHQIWDNPSAPSLYVFSHPIDFDANNAETLITKANMCGRTSDNISSYSSTDMFSTKNENIEHISERSFYGGENAPEFVACLPLIKI